MGGGFVGVDVFFVISGYLITRNLLREVERTHRVALATFWGKRIRRLVPALGLVVVVTLVASVVVLPLFRWSEVAREGGASSLYVSNFLFASASEDYFAADVAESPFLHTWSLSVEEQFYLVWPVLALGAALAAKRRPRRIRSILVGVFGVVLVASLAASVLLTPTSPSWAFYGLHTRAWEFAAAGLLAAAVLPRWFGRASVRWAGAIGGLGLIAFAGFQLSSSTAYPGAWALLPVVGTLLLLASGDPTPGGAPVLPTKALSLAPVQWLGRVSYSWYLWHWPAIVLTVAVLDDDRPAVRVAASIAALGLAHLTYRYYENPVRFSPWLTGSNRRTIVAGAGASVLVLALVAGIGTEATRREGQDTLEARLALAREDVRPKTCELAGTSPSGTDYCIAGRPDAARTVMLVGDSHAAHWITALDEAAVDASVRLVYRWRGGCPVIDVALVPTVKGSQADVDACLDHRGRTQRLVEELRPQAVVLAHSNEYGSRLRRADGSEVARSDRSEVWGVALDDLVTELQGELGIRVGVIIDNPIPREDPVECIATAGSVAPCRPSVQDSLHRTAGIRAVERDVASAHGAPIFDITDELCDESSCALEVDGQLVYADRGHLLSDYTRTHVPGLTTFIDQLLTAQPT